MNTNNSDDLFNELLVLWALYELGGKADKNTLYNKCNEMSVSNHGKSLKYIINKMIESEYPKNKLKNFLKIYGISVNIDNKIWQTK